MHLWSFIACFSINLEILSRNDCNTIFHIYFWGKNIIGARYDVQKQVSYMSIRLYSILWALYLSWYVLLLIIIINKRYNFCIFGKLFIGRVCVSVGTQYLISIIVSFVIPHSEHFCRIFKGIFLTFVLNIWWARYSNWLWEIPRTMLFFNNTWYVLFGY